MKNIKKAISVFLAVIMLLSTFSVSYSVFAQEITENETTDEEPEDFDELPEVLYEDVSLRTEYSKTYILSDGSFRTKFFSYKVHTLNDDGTYTETSSGDSSSGRRRARQIPVSGIGVNGTYVSSASQSSNFSDESFILLGSGNIGLIETSSFSDGYSEGYRISSAILTLSAQTEDVNAVVYAYDINEAFDVNNVTYSSKPSYSASPVDYSGVSEEGTISLDITQQLSEESYGIALVSSDDISVEKQSMSGAVSVTYTITSGLNEEQEYAVFDIGSAGTVYVNKLTGNLVMTRDGISTGDGEHGFDLTSTYNSTIANNEISSWQTSATSGFASYSLFYDENGTCHYLAVSKENENDEYYSFTEENEFGFEKIKATAFKTITIIVLAHTFSFEVPVAFEVIADEGKKIYQFDSSGIKSIQESEDNEDNENNTWKTVLCRTDNDDNTSDLIDGDGNKIHTNTTSSCITRTQILKDNTTGDAEIEYKDSEGNISSVEINDSVIATYTYDDNNRVTSVTNSKGYGLSFTYDGESKRIASVQEYKGASAGKKITYSRTFDTCTERTEGADGVFGNDDDLFTTYTFDNNCSLICAQNKAGGEELNSVSYKYENDIVSSAALGGKISDNYLKNHNIESLANWTSIAKDDPDCQYTVAYSTEAQYVGEGSVKVTATDFTDNGLAGVYQAFNVNDSSLIRKGENYVVSGFIRTDGITRDSDTLSSRNYGAVIMLRIHYDDGTEAKRTYTESVRNTGEKWERVFASVKIPNNCDRLGVYLMIKNGTGTAYFDAVQLEKGTAPGEYNLLENNSFDYTENTTSNTGNTWVRSALTSTDAISDGKFRINASVTANKYFRQEINLVNASQSDKYILSAKVKASSASPTKSTFAMRARFYYADGTEKYITTKFSSYNDGVQFLQSGFDLSTTQTDAVPVKIRVSFLYYKNINCAEVETMSLVRASDVYLFDNSEDDDIEDAGSYTYNENGDVLTYTDEEGNITTYTYDDSGELTEVETKDSDDNVIYGATYSNGNLISETENGDTTSYTYNENGDVLTYTDEEGNITTYTYSDSGELTEVETKDSDDNVIYNATYSNGNLISETENGVSVVYTYDDNGNVSSVSKDGKTIGYLYTGDNLTSVTRNGNSYNYEYDEWDNKSSVKIGSQPLESYTYQHNNGSLSEKTYGNGDAESYTYNAYGQISKITLSGLGNYQFKYDSQGNLLYQRDNVGNRQTYYLTDEYGRNAGEHVVTVTPSNAYANELYRTGYTYNDEGEISQKTLSSDHLKVSDDYTYSENQVVSDFTASRGVTAVYDADGNLTTRTISTTTPFVQSYTYNDDSLITSETRGGENYSYTYDSDGRITGIIKDNVLRQSYVYDSEGQLVRENNLDTNKTVIYNYDNGGNITSKKEYAFTTGEVGAEINTVNYTYGDSSWNDKLTSYNGESISYDAIGNPTSYRGAVCTYFGRQLQSYTKGDTAISYKYDIDGLRTSKTVNGVQHDYYYVDRVLVYEKAGDEYELFYRYDADGRLSFISRKSFSDNSVTSFSVVTDTQGDVVKIISGNGNVSAEYTYDAWGNIVSVKTGSGATITNQSHIGLQNSIRYRGYVYDSETEMYYLQSRYYDPETGRFINCDAPDYIGLGDTFTSWNGFAYCENDPVNNEDPTGNWLIQVVCGVAGAAVFGTVANIMCRLLGVNATIRRLITAGFALIGGALGAAFGPALVGKIAPKALAWVNNLEKIINRKSRLRPMLFEGHVAIGWEWDRRFKIMLHFKHKDEPEKGMHIAIQHFTGRNWRRTIPDIPIKSLGKVFINWVKKFLK